MQMCEECGKNAANVHLTQISADGAEVTHLCEECARNKGISISIEGGENKAEATATQDADPGVTCSRCGTTQAQLRETGRIGCRECYTAFADEIDKLLNQMHGSCVHQGKRYSRVGTIRGTAADIERLRTELNKAIQNEDFEEAARLRDTISSLSSIDQ
jgi:protein arginine kinase activator